MFVGRRKPPVRSLFLVAASSLVAALVVPTASLAVSPAGVASSSCPDGWTQVGSSSICEKVVTASSTVSVPEGVSSMDAVVVGGGGGGGGSAGRNVPGAWAYGAGGGGGGGQVSYCADLSVSGSLSVTVGGGGSGGSGSHDVTGTVQGSSGGDGGSSSAGSCSAAGGSGGTGGVLNSSSVTGFGVGGSSGNGNAGGTSVGNTITCVPDVGETCRSTGNGSGGGGGASATGGTGFNGTAGNGGAGSTPSSGLFAGASTTYGGGGGGASGYSNGSGGSGGGGSGGQTSSPEREPTSGTANTGGGGGGAINWFNKNDAPSGGSGGSGIVVLRFDLDDIVIAIETTTTAQVSSSEILLGATIDDTATVSAVTGSSDPLGSVQFYYCWTASGSSPPTTCDASVGTPIGSPISVSSTGSAGVVEAKLMAWEPALVGNYRLFAAFTGTEPFSDSADDGTNRSLEVGEESPPITDPPTTDPPRYSSFNRAHLMAGQPAKTAKAKPSGFAVSEPTAGPAFIFGIALLIGNPQEGDVDDVTEMESPATKKSSSRSTIFWLLMGALVGYFVTLSQYLLVSRRVLRPDGGRFG